MQKLVAFLDKISSESLHSFLVEWTNILQDAESEEQKRIFVDKIKSFKLGNSQKLSTKSFSFSFAVDNLQRPFELTTPNNISYYLRSNFSNKLT